MDWLLKVLEKTVGELLAWIGRTFAGPILRFLGRLSLKARFVTGAIFAYWLTHAVEGGPDNALLLSKSYFARAQQRYDKSLAAALTDLDSAISVLEAERTRGSDSDELRITLADYLNDRMLERYEAQEWEKVILDCNRLLALNSPYHQQDAFYVNRAYAELKIGKRDEAITTLETARDSFDTELVRSRLYQHLFDRSKELYKKKELEKVIPDLEKMAEVAPDDKTRLVLISARADAQRLVGDFEGAAATLREARAKFPANAKLTKQLLEVLDGYWQALADKGDGQTLENIANEQLALCDPGNSDQLSQIYAKRAIAYLTSDNPEAAVADATLALKHDPTNSVAMISRALAKRVMALDEDALNDLNSAISKEDPATLRIALRERAHTLLSMRRHDDALKDYLRLIEQPKDSVSEDYLGAAECYNATGRHRETVNMLTPLLAGQAQLADSSLWIARADAYYVLGEYANAAEDYDAAKNLDSTSSGAYFGRALSLIQLSESATPKNGSAHQLLRDVVENLRRTIELEPNFAAPYFHLADVLSRLGEHEAAAQAINNIKDRQENLPSTRAGDTSTYELGDLWRLLDTPLAPAITEEFEDLAKRSPKDPLAQYGAGRTSLLESENPQKSENAEEAAKEAAKKTQDARHYFSEAIRLDPHFSEAYAWRGLARVRSDDFSGAIEDGNVARSLNKQSALANAVIGYAQTFLRNYPEAVAMLKEAIALDPTYLGAYDYLLRIRIYLKEWDAALNESTQAIEAGLRDASIYVSRAETLLSLRRIEDGIRDCSEALNLNESSWRAYYIRGLLLGRQENYEAALSDFNFAQQFNPPAAEAALICCAQSEIWRTKGSSGQSLALLNLAIEKDPKCALAYYQRGWVSITKNVPDDAIGDFDWLLQQDDQNSKAVGYCGRAEAKRLSGKLDEALVDASRAIALQPDYYFAYGVRGRIYVDRGQWDSAIENFSKALKEEPPHPQFFFWRGECRRIKQEFDAAIADCSAAIAQDNKFPWSYYSRGLSHASKENWDSALADLQSARNLDPTNAQFLSGLGWAHYRTGNWQSVLEFSGQALELDPKSVLDLSRKAEVLVYLGRAAEAVEAYSSVVSLEEKEGLAGRGWARSFAGDFDGAIEDLTRALSLTPGDSIALDNLAWAKNRKGEWQAALEDSSKAIEIAPSSLFAHHDRAFSRFQLGDASGAHEDLLFTVLNCLTQPVFLPKRTPHNSLPWTAVAEDWHALSEQKRESAIPILGHGLAKWMAGAVDEATVSLDTATALDGSLAATQIGRVLVALEANQLAKVTTDLDSLTQRTDLDQLLLQKLTNEVQMRRSRDEQITMPKLGQMPALESQASRSSSERLK